MQLRCRRQRMKSSSSQGNSKLSRFDRQDLGHVAADHPADVDANFLFLVGLHAGLLPCRPVGGPGRAATLAPIRVLPQPSASKENRG